MATPYSQLPYGFRRGEENYAYGEYLRKQRELKRATDFADRIAAEEERISLERWQPEPEQQEVKITTKADGTSTIVSTDKFPAQSLLDDPMGLEGTGTGDWGLSVTSGQAELDELRRINDLYAMGGQGDVGEVWTTPSVAVEDPLGLGRPQNQWDQVPGDIAAEQDRIAYERQFTPTQSGHPLHQYWDGEKFVSTLEEEPVVSPEGIPISGVDMGGLQRFDPYIPPDEAYRQAYGEQERVMGMRGLLEEEARRAAIPPPDVQVAGPHTQMVDRAIEQVDRGTANILPPIDFPPVLPGGGGAEAPFVAPQAITPEQGPLGPPGQYSVGPPAITQGEREAELAAALGEGGARYGQALPMQGLLTDEEILAGAQMPYGDPGETAMERALRESVEGPIPEVSDFDPFAGIEPEPSVETDILESQVQGWVDPDTGLKPAPGKIRTRQEIMGEALPRGAMRDTSREFNKLVQKVSDKTTGTLTEEDMDLRILGMMGEPIEKVAKTVDKMYQMQKTSAMMALVEGMKKKSKARNLKVTGRRRQQREMALLNPTPLTMGNA